MPSPSAEAPSSSSRPALAVLLAAPRGFCAGVDRAIQIVELALAKFGAPVYVRHEIVHNRYVVESLKAKGAVFVEELNEIPETDQPVIFSAHGVPKSVPQAAKSRNMFAIDATCPLVFKVHMEAGRHFAEGRKILLIGHAGHPEVEGTTGQLPEGAVTLIEDAADAEAFEPEDAARLAYVTQTTLSVDDTAAIVAILKRRFPAIVGPHKEDICYATTNRQAAVKAIAGSVGLMLVVGAPNSSNSLRLVEVAERAGCPKAVLIQRAADIPWTALDGVTKVGVTAGASAPETLVDEVIAALKSRFDVTVEQVTTASERIAFNVPRELREPADA
jgi:4-hydroxy-3-methylbut-2-enyl diphosphate reductase